MDGRRVQPRAASNLARFPSLSHSHFVLPLPVINVRCSIRHNEAGSENTSPQMSNFRSPHWGNCKHKSSKVYNFRALVSEHCHFSSARAFLQRQTPRSFITRSLVLWNNGAGLCVRVRVHVPVPAAFTVTVSPGQAGMCSPASLISNKTAELTWGYTMRLTGCANRQWLQT